MALLAARFTLHMDTLEASSDDSAVGRSENLREMGWRGINNVVGIMGIVKIRPPPPGFLRPWMVSVSVACYYHILSSRSFVRSLACLLLHFQEKGHKMVTRYSNIG